MLEMLKKSMLKKENSTTRKKQQCKSFQNKKFARPMDKKSLEKSVSEADKTKCKVRRQIEDWHLARELELKHF